MYKNIVKRTSSAFFYIQFKFNYTMLILCVLRTCGACDPYASIRTAMLKLVIICMRFLHLLCWCIFVGRVILYCE